MGAGGEDAIEAESVDAFVPTNPEAFTYDADGNLTEDGRWRHSWNAMNRLVAMEDAAFCLRTLERAVEARGPPEVFNSDQGCQFTGDVWTKALGGHKVKISMDGRGRALDNAFVERLWRSAKYEEVYRREYQSMGDFRRHLGAYFRFYNERRPRSSLGGRTPDEIHHLARLTHAA